jgi:hypothetical protein
MARRTEGLPHLGTYLPTLPVFQSLPPHSNSFGRLHTAGGTFPACPHRPCGAPPNVGGLHMLPHCSRPFHPLAGSRPYPRHHGRHRGTRPTDGLDIPLRLSADHHHRPRTSVRVSTFSLPGQAMWHPTLTDNSPSPRV